MLYTKCNKCALGDFRDENDYKIVWGEGSLNADIMVVGEAPGKKEAETGKPFVGKSGKYLRIELFQRFTEENVFIINTVMCRPPENRDPLPEEQNKCYQHIYTQINLVKPKIFITVGKVSSNWFSKIIGEDYQIYKMKLVEFGDLKFIWAPLYHPAYITRKVSLKEDFGKAINHINKLYRNIK